MVYETNCTEITQDKWRELMKYEVLVVSDEKVGDKEIHIL